MVQSMSQMTRQVLRQHKIKRTKNYRLVCLYWIVHHHCG